METKFIPKNPQTLDNFDQVLAEYNRVNDTMLHFTDSYSTRIDLYVSEETTADGYGIWTIREDGERLDMDNIYYYEPSCYDIFNRIEEIGNYGDFNIYIGDISRTSDIEYYMMEQLETNYDDYLQDLEDNKEE